MMDIRTFSSRLIAFFLSLFLSPGFLEDISRKANDLWWMEYIYSDVPVFLNILFKIWPEKNE